MEKCQSQGQQAASSHLRDRRSIPPPSPAGGKARRWKPREEKEHTPPVPWTSGELARRGPKRGLARGAAGAKPGAREGAAAGGPTSARRLLRAAAAAPPPPSRATLETDLGESAGARAFSLSLCLLVSSLIYSLDCLGRRRRRRRGRRRGDGAGEGVGVDAGMGEWQAERLVAGRGSVWLLRASQREVAGGGQREGWASEQSGGDGPGAALHTRQKGTPKVGVGLLPPPGVRRGSGPSPAGLPGDSQPPSGHLQASELQPSTWLESSGVIFAQAGTFPQPFSQAQNPLPA